MTLRIGTRGSKLALAQANEIKAALERAHEGLRCEVVVLKTGGDDFTTRKTDGTVPLKGLFVKEIEEALLENRIELAVHSVKDLQAELPVGLTLAGVLKRQDPRDALVTTDGKGWKDLPMGTTIGVSSLRRQAQLMRLRRDLELVPIRGNVDTRLRKLDEGEVGALVLAACGLIRLQLEGRISQMLGPTEMVPALGQGALGIEIRQDHQEMVALVEKVSHSDSFLEVKAERAFLKALGGGCQVPVGGLARVQGEGLTLVGAVFSPDGLKAVRREIAGPKQAAERLGVELASHVRAAGADRLLYGQWARQ